VHTLDVWQCRFGSQEFLGGIGLIGSARTTTKSNKYQIDSMNKKNQKKKRRPFTKDLIKAIDAAREWKKSVRLVLSLGPGGRPTRFGRLNCTLQLRAATLLTDSLAVDNAWL
jgi:hypothetical protein